VAMFEILTHLSTPIYSDNNLW